MTLVCTIRGTNTFESIAAAFNVAATRLILFEKKTLLEYVALQPTPLKL